VLEQLTGCHLIGSVEMLDIPDRTVAARTGHGESVDLAIRRGQPDPTAAIRLAKRLSQDAKDVEVPTLWLDFRPGVGG
jgi:hypothetical protein